MLVKKSACEIKNSVYTICHYNLCTVYMFFTYIYICYKVYIILNKPVVLCNCYSYLFAFLFMRV